MKAVGFTQSLPIENEKSFIDFETEKPKPGPKDILVKIKAISVNPVDYKVRQSASKDAELDTPKIIGWDAAGIVEEIGKEVKFFNVGDEVFYSGDITRPGCYAEFQLVDERIAAHKPKNLTWEAAAALPLTSLTAWECIFDRLRIKENSGKDKNVLIISGAGGVGSIAIQLLKTLTKFKVIATASRDVSRNWCEKMGADDIVDYHNLVDNLKSYKNIDYILNFADTSGNWNTMAELISPQGSICCIVNTTENVDLNLLKEKSVSFHWELMFTRSKFNTRDMLNQHKILESVKSLIDDDKIQTTMNRKFEGLSSETLKKVHKLQETGKSVGKNIISYY